MPVSRFVRFCFFLGFLCPVSAQAQLGYELDIKKPEPYENRELKAEKTPSKKIGQPKKFIQNSTTHYNYVFNAQNKIQEVLDRAKTAHKDDYTQLLPFYNYELAATAADSLQLDSVILKAKTGIVLHDLRNDWIDNLYLLWGMTYYLREQYDSAHQMFQFINWAFAEKEKDGYYKYIGTRSEETNALTIATKEKNGLAQRALAEPPARNDALIWQVRTLIQQDEFPEAASIIAMLRADPAFPKRLNAALHEVQSLWYYKQQAWDSSAIHLVQALPQARKGQERVRWEYLAGQMFAKAGMNEQARTWFRKVADKADDPVIEVYARLNLILLNKDAAQKGDEHIAELVKMARRDKYEDYRDVIYSTLARMEIERKNFVGAWDYLRKASKYKGANAVANNNAYLELADNAFNSRQYKLAASFYDSVQVANIPTADADRITERKSLLKPLLQLNGIIERQDSLQRIAAMPEDERNEFLKKLLRQLRREQGLKEDAGSLPGTGTAPDPFTAQQQTKGEWYFYNNGLRKTGAASFKQVWGNRPNVDNWRRQSDVTAELRNKIPEKTRNAAPGGRTDADPLSFEGLTAGLPFTPEDLKRSNDSIQYALFGLARLYANELEDYPASATSFESIRSRFRTPDSLDAVLFGLYYDYTKTGDAAKAAEMKRLLLSQFPNSRYALILTTGVDPLSARPSSTATKTYENIYDLFIEGRYTEAVAAKKVADSTYGPTYWTPQLLYIEAIYQVRSKQDSLAKGTLATLISRNGGTPLALKAQNLLNVLNRRKQIEEELTALQVTRPAEDSLFVEPMPIAPPVARKENVTVQPQRKDTANMVKVQPPVARPKSDTTIQKPVVQKPAVAGYTFKAATAHYAVVLLDNVDAAFVTEAKNSFIMHNRRNFAPTVETKMVSLNDTQKMLLIGSFADAAGAVDYIQKVKPVTPTQILPWLRGGKYSFTILSEENLPVLLQAKDIAPYQKFLDQVLPVKF